VSPSGRHGLFPLSSVISRSPDELIFPLPLFFFSHNPLPSFPSSPGSKAAANESRGDSSPPLPIGLFFFRHRLFNFFPSLRVRCPGPFFFLFNSAVFFFLLIEKKCGGSPFFFYHSCLSFFLFFFHNDK